MKVDKIYKDESGYVTEVRKNIILIGSDRRVPGLTVFEFNIHTYSLRPAKIKEVVSVTGVSSEINYEVDAQPGCVYVQAINKKVAAKKVKRDRGISLIFDGDTIKPL